MSFWTLALFVYLALSVPAFALVMSLLIIGKRSDQRCLSPYNKTTLQPTLHPRAKARIISTKLSKAKMSSLGHRQDKGLAEP